MLIAILLAGGCFFLRYKKTNVLKVLEALSDDVSINLFEIIQKYRKNTNDLKQGLHLTYKQAYSRVQKLIDAGIVKRNGSYYYVTSFGLVISQACTKIAKGIEYLPELKIADTISDSEVSEEKYAELIDRLLQEPELKKAILNHDRKF